MRSCLHALRAGSLLHRTRSGKHSPPGPLTGAVELSLAACVYVPVQHVNLQLAPHVTRLSSSSWSSCSVILGGIRPLVSSKRLQWLYMHHRLPDQAQHIQPCVWLQVAQGRVRTRRSC